MLAGMFLSLPITTTAAVAQTSIHEGATILMFPRVVVDGTSDTILQITNTGNLLSQARCFYVSSANNLNQSTSFNLTLLAQQPIRWTASAGTSFDVLVGQAVYSVSIPSIPTFRGELRCFEVDESGYPFSSNKLVGSATIKNRQSRDVAGYTAIGLPGTVPFFGQSGEIMLDGTSYQKCPQTWTWSHRSEPLGFTIVPCAENLATGFTPSVTVSFTVTNELGGALTASRTISGWSEFLLSDLDPAGPTFSKMNRAAIGTDYARTTITSSKGVLVLAEERVAPGSSATASLSNLWSVGEQAQSESIVLPVFP